MISATAVVTKIANIGFRPDLPIQDGEALTKRITVEAASGIYEIDLDPEFAKEIQVGDKLLLNNVNLIDDRILIPNETSIIAKALVNPKESPLVKARLLASRTKLAFEQAATSQKMDLKISSFIVYYKPLNDAFGIGLFVEKSLRLSFLNDLSYQLNKRFSNVSHDMLLMGEEETKYMLNQEAGKNLISAWFLIGDYNFDKSEKITFSFDSELNDNSIPK